MDIPYLSTNKQIQILQRQAFIKINVTIHQKINNKYKEITSHRHDKVYQTTMYY
jgi:hypothetical protein